MKGNQKKISFSSIHKPNMNVYFQKARYHITAKTDLDTNVKNMAIIIWILQLWISSLKLQVVSEGWKQVSGDTDLPTTEHFSLKSKLLTIQYQASLFPSLKHSLLKPSLLNIFIYLQCGHPMAIVASKHHLSTSVLRTHSKCLDSQ